MKYFLLLITAAGLLITKANGQQKNRNKAKLTPITIMAWYEDTASLYQFALTYKTRFYYTVIHKLDKDSTIEMYNGHCSLLNDTLFLYFDKIYPKLNRFQPYLILEGSGTYLMQTFKNDPTKIFLRIHKPRLS